MITSNPSKLGVNPYVGPRPFETGRPIFGRNREIEDLYDLLSAERIVLLYSPSGAGKSSLIQAGLLPQLSRRFDVWGPTRVNLHAPADLPADVNRYVRSAILGFEQGLPEARRRSEEQLARLSLSEYVQGRPRKRSAPENIVLLFDQFEEVLTTDPLAIEAKRGFFRQLGDLLLDRRIWALFALREDYLAPLDPYAEQVPTHLKNRFRLDLLGLEAAAEAITRPALEAGRECAPEAIEKLVHDLATMKVQQPDGAFVDQVGHHVEPLQLQVVCRRLWDRMPETDPRIDLEDVNELGDVTDALSGYYAGEVARIAGGDVRVERALREWCGEKLITRDGIRGQVLRGAGQSEGLENDRIARLVDTHLVRGEQRAGAVWYELAHDRLIEPVRSNNRDWFDAHLRNVQKVATLWEAQGRPEGLLLLGAELLEAKQWAEQNDSSLTPIERKFLEASSAKQEAIEKELRQARQLRLRSTIAVLVALIALLALGGTLYFWKIAKRDREEADRQRDSAQRQEELTKQAARGARDQARVAKAGELLPIDPTKAALLLLEVEEPDDPTLPITKKLIEALNHPFTIAELKGHKSLIYTVDFSPDGKRLLTASQDGSVAVWDIDGQGAPRMLEIRPNDGTNHSARAAFSKNGTLIFAETKFVGQEQSGEVKKIWSLVNGEWVELPESKTTALSSEMETAFTALSEDKQRDDVKHRMIAPLPAFNAVTAVWQKGRLQEPALVATVSTDFAARVWRDQTNAAELALPHSLPIDHARFSNDGRKVVTLTSDGTGRIWEIQNLQRPTAQPFKLLSGSSTAPAGRNITIFSPDDAYVLTLRAGVLQLRPSDVSQKPILLGKEEAGRAVGAAFNSKNDIIAVYEDWKVRVWGLDGKIKNLHELSRPRNHGPILDTKFGPDASTFLTISAEEGSQTRLHRLHGFSLGKTLGKPIYQMVNTGPDFVYDFRPDLEAILLSNQGNETMESLEIKDKVTRNVLPIAWPSDAGFSPLGDRLVIATRLKEARVWFSRDGGGEPVVLAKAPCPNLDFKHIQEWNACIRAWSASFSQDGTRVITHETSRQGMATSGEVLIWDLDPRRLMSKVRAATPLCLDADFRRKTLAETPEVAGHREKACRVCVPPFQKEHKTGSPEKSLASYRDCLKANGW